LEHKLLTEALKGQALCIAINRKDQPLPALTKQDFESLKSGPAADDAAQDS
jgi:hypothetical protein